MAKMPEDEKEARAIWRREMRADPTTARNMADIVWAVRRSKRKPAKGGPSGADRNRRFLWVFNGLDSEFPGGIFPSRRAAAEWIALHELHGTLTRYPVGVGIFDFAITEGVFTPRTAKESSASFIANFSAASLEQYDY